MDGMHPLEVIVVRRLVPRLGVVLVAAMLTAALVSPGTPVLGQGAPIRIGVVVAVTGPASSLGKAEKDTATMLVPQLDPIGGRQIQLVVYDSESDPTQALLLMKKTVSEDNVVAVVGGTSSPEAQAMADYAMQAGIPYMSLAASTTLSVPARTWVFQTPQRNSIAAAKVAGYLAATHVRTIVFLYRNDDFGQDGLVALQTYLPRDGITIVDTEPFEATATDLTAQVTRARVHTPDAWVVWSTPPTASTAAKNIRQLGIAAPIIESHGVANQAFIDLAGPAANGVVFPAGKLLVVGSLAAADPQKAVLQRYAQDFNAANHYPANTFGGHAYDGITLLLAAIRAVGPDRAKMRDYIEHVHGFVGIGGVFNMSPQDHNGLTTNDMALVVIRDGHWQQWK